MPFTPYHFGPISWISLLGIKYLNIAAFLIASVIIDVEPFLVIVFSLNYPLHGFLHTILGGTIVAFILAVVLFHIRDLLNKIMAIIKLNQESTFKTILFSCLVGVYSHIFLDSFLYSDIKPLYPFGNNPLFGMVSYKTIYLFCSYSFLLGALFYIVRLIKIKRKA
jgi:membrane-bound metal-dependent hydrolase YbcI (DUF457 family)